MAALQLTADGIFQITEIDQHAEWRGVESGRGTGTSPISFQVDGTAYEGRRIFKLISQHWQTSSAATAQQFIVLEDLAGKVRVRIELDMYADIRCCGIACRSRICNRRTFLRKRRSDAICFFGGRADDPAASGGAMDDRKPNQRIFNHHRPRSESGWNFGDDVDGLRMEALCVAGLAPGEQNNRGLFAGWEFDGQAKASAQIVSGTLQLAASILTLIIRLRRARHSNCPRRFWASIRGLGTKAGSRTQQFSESVS